MMSEEWGKPVPPWREACAAPGSTQVSPLRCAPVEMTVMGCPTERVQEQLKHNDKTGISWFEDED